MDQNLRNPSSLILSHCQNGLPWLETWTNTCGLPRLFDFEPHNWACCFEGGPPPKEVPHIFACPFCLLLPPVFGQFWSQEVSTSVPFFGGANRSPFFGAADSQGSLYSCNTNAYFLLSQSTQCVQGTRHPVWEALTMQVRDKFTPTSANGL